MKTTKKPKSYNKKAFSHLIEAILDKTKPKGAKGKSQIKRDRKNNINKLRRAT